MRFPIAIEPGDDKHAFGVIVPDLPGCFSAGDTLDEAIELWLEMTIDDGAAIPELRSVDEHQLNLEFSGCTWAVVTIDLSNSLTKRKE